MSAIVLYLFGLVWFYSISTIVGYFMPNPFYTYKSAYLTGYLQQPIRGADELSIIIQINKKPI